MLVTLLAQFTVWQYGRGVVRTAAIEAARAAAPDGAPAGSCERRFDDVRATLLGGAVGDGIGAPRCLITDDRVVVSVSVTFRAWLPISPDWSFDVVAVATRERVVT